MVKWTNDEVRELTRLFSEEKLSIDALSVRFNRQRKAVENKLRRLGFDIASKRSEETEGLNLPYDLPSLKKALSLVAGAFEKAGQKGLTRIDLQQLDTIGNLYKIYEAGLEKFMRWSEIEAKLFETEKKYAELFAKEKGSESNQVSS